MRLLIRVVHKRRLLRDEELAFFTLNIEELKTNIMQFHVVEVARRSLTLCTKLTVVEQESDSDIESDFVVVDKNANQDDNGADSDDNEAGHHDSEVEDEFVMLQSSSDVEVKLISLLPILADYISLSTVGRLACTSQALNFAIKNDVLRL